MTTDVSTMEMLAVPGRHPLEKEYLLLSLQNEGAAVWGDTPPITQLTFRFQLGVLSRTKVMGRIRGRLDLHDIDYALDEEWGCLWSVYTLAVTIGSWDDLSHFLGMCGEFRKLELS